MEYQVREEDIRGAVRRLSFSGIDQSPNQYNDHGFACIKPTFSDSKLINVLHSTSKSCESLLKS